MSLNTPNTKQGQLWGGRFKSSPNSEFFMFNRSFGFDSRLLEADIQGTRAHIQVLLKANLVESTDASKLNLALDKLLEEVLKDPNLLKNEEVEDVHSFIESFLTSELGDLGKRVHTGRSRNDQVATALRVWLVQTSQEVRSEINNLIGGLANLAEAHSNLIIPGYTHLQRAQPVLFSHWCLAYSEMLLRDRSRLDDLQKRLKVLPLGSGALAGAGLPLDRSVALEALGFEALSENSLDAVSDRDFVLEWQSFACLVMVHLSRLAEDMILYTSSEFGILTLGDEVSSGSSLMPQKKNPDALELIRGKSGRVFGSFMGMLTVLKGLPLAYNKDLQEDKESLFDVVDTVALCLRNTNIVLSHTQVNSNFTLPLSEGFMEATDLADLCVMRGMPFREAHEKVGRLVRKAIELGVGLTALPEEEVSRILPGLNLELSKALDTGSCLNRKAVYGGSSPERVKEALQRLKNKI